MFAPISAIFAFLLLPGTLPNGIQLTELPAEGDMVSIVAGYNEPGLQNLASTSAARSLIFSTYAAGGTVQFSTERDRTSLRFTLPKWAAALLSDDQLAAFFKEIPKRDRGSDPSSPDPPDFRGKVEEEIRGALLGSRSPSVDYATDDAFLLISAPVSDSLRAGLAAVARRASNNLSAEPIEPLAAERTLRFKSDLPAGAVIYASPIPAVYYRQWYLFLVLDRLIHRVVRLPLQTALPLGTRPYYYRIELAVPAGQFPEPVEASLLQELERLQFTPASAKDLAAARDESAAYLESSEVREWYTSYGIPERRVEGIQWILSMTADDLRGAARDLLISNRVIATWAPRPKQTTVTTESLSNALPQSLPSVRGQRAAVAPVESPIAITFPPHTDSVPASKPPEQLPSGVYITESTINAVFISGGALARFDHEFTSDDMKPFQKYRPDRILVLTPQVSLSRAREIWSSFSGNTAGESGVAKGEVSGGDLPALFILKTALDLRLIQAGWWRDVELRIEAGAGTSLQIRADDEHRAQILGWIKEIAMRPLSENDFARVREVAIHHFGFSLPDLQALTWERDPRGALQGLSTIGFQHVQDVARIYF